MEFMKLHLPDIIKWDDDSLTDKYGKLTITALERGFGRTLATALRRVMLSSLEGSAPVSVKVKGAEHEFSTLDGVLEDVTDIILNVKSLAVRTSSEEPVTLSLQANEVGVYTASAFETDVTDVHIANPEQVIAEISTDGGELDIEVTIEQGKGFVTQDEWYNENKGRDIGTILVDSWFCPVKKVHFDVESARVGDRTDFDRLIMEITTDGSISPKEAIENSTSILMRHFEMILGIGIEEPVVENEIEENEENMVDEAIEQIEEKVLEDVELTATSLSTRYIKILSADEVTTIDQLATKTESELLALRNFGKTALEIVKELLEEHSRSLTEEKG